MTSALLASSNLFNIKGWVCLVSGGGTGIGLMIAQTLAASGAKVYITGRRLNVLEDSAKVHGSPEALKGSGGSMIPVQMDVTDKQSLLDAAKFVKSKEAHLNLLVNNAGINPPRVEMSEDAESLSKAMMDQDPKDWARCFETNITSLFFTTAAFLPLLSQAKPEPGSIVNITSISGITKMSQNGQFAYNSSKSGAIQMTNLLAKELGTQKLGIRVNSIAPGYFPSEMTASTSDSQTHKSTLDDEKYRKEGIPAGRAGRDTDMGQAVLSLALNRYCWGQNLVIDGGFLLVKP